MSDVVVLCDICGKIAKNTCSLCGRRVCEEHYDSNLGICTSCKSGKRQAKK